jgi:hypothetical protein
MWRTETRFDRRYMEALLHADFTKIGRSGRKSLRSNVLEMRSVDINIQVPLCDLAFSNVTEGAFSSPARQCPKDPTTAPRGVYAEGCSKANAGCSATNGER